MGASGSVAQNFMSLKNFMSLTRGYVMRQFDLSPLYRSTIGFDRLFNLLDQAGAPENGATAYPPYNIERTGENAYRLTLAVAGFSDAELSIEYRQNALTIKGAKEQRETGELLYQGIAARAFERRFQLADHVQVAGARLENGLLHVDLVREVPEAQRPRSIPIGSAAPAAKTVDQPTVVETPRAA